MTDVLFVQLQVISQGVGTTGENHKSRLAEGHSQPGFVMVVAPHGLKRLKESSACLSLLSDNIYIYIEIVLYLHIRQMYLFVIYCKTMSL